MKAFKQYVQQFHEMFLQFFCRKRKTQNELRKRQSFLAKQINMQKQTLKKLKSKFLTGETQIALRTDFTS